MSTNCIYHAVLRNVERKKHNEYIINVPFLLLNDVYLYGNNAISQIRAPRDNTVISCLAQSVSTP